MRKTGFLMKDVGNDGMKFRGQNSSVAVFVIFGIEDREFDE